MAKLWPPSSPQLLRAGSELEGDRPRGARDRAGAAEGDAGLLARVARALARDRACADERALTGAVGRDGGGGAVHLGRRLARVRAGEGTRTGFFPVAAPAVAAVASTNARTRTEIRNFFTVTPFKA